MALKEKMTKTMTSLLSIDDEIKKLSSKTKELKKQRELIENELLEIIKKNNLENKKFLLNNRKLFLNKCITLAPLNIKLLEEVLSKHLGITKTNIILKDIEKYRNDNKKELLKVKRKLDKKSLKKKNT